MNERVSEEMTEERKVRRARRAANLTGTVTGTKEALETKAKGKGKSKGKGETRYSYDCGEQGHIGVNCPYKLTNSIDEEGTEARHGKVRLLEKRQKN